ncbi:MAG TPA: hypothetical protein VGJ22_01440, partial [Anaerolineales bacterium]
METISGISFYRKIRSFPPGRQEATQMRHKILQNQYLINQAHPAAISCSFTASSLSLMSGYLGVSELTQDRALSEPKRRGLRAQNKK